MSVPSDLSTIRSSIKTISEIINDTKGSNHDRTFWDEIGAKLLVIMDKTVVESTLCNSLVPLEYSDSDSCILTLVFQALQNIPKPNDPFTSPMWLKYISESELDQEPLEENTISFYELAFSRYCAFVCQLLGDRFQYVEKLLIKNLFSVTDVNSLFASDILMFIFRILHPNHRTALCQLIINLCKLAPPEALIKGAALINRMNHPVVNFENPKFSYILDTRVSSL